MTHKTSIDRRRFLARTLEVGGVALLAGCDALSRTEWFPRILNSAGDDMRGRRGIFGALPAGMGSAR
ncbi:MAG: hypothetical protein L0H73_02320 [Nitrococcus sp.]|nr:hypothetical protein [Nitrococcus sp.]